MDLSGTVAPNSDQLDAVDIAPFGPAGRTFTIERVTAGNAEQPVNVHLREFDRPWRPGKSMRRVLIAVWGANGADYAGRRLTLWCDPEVKFGGIAVGGVRIRAMEGIEKPRDVSLIVSRGKVALYTVQPLPNVSEIDRLRDEYRTATPERRAEIEARVAELKAGGSDD